MVWYILGQFPFGVQSPTTSSLEFPGNRDWLWYPGLGGLLKSKMDITDVGLYYHRKSLIVQTSRQPSTLRQFTCRLLSYLFAQQVKKTRLNTPAGQKTGIH